MSKKKTKQRRTANRAVFFYLDAGMAKKLDQVRQAKRRSLSSLCREAVEDALNEWKSEEKKGERNDH